MCGIAGRILPTYGQVGKDLVELMEAQSHRGADSTGFAIYTHPVDKGFKLRMMGFNKKNLEKDLDDFWYILKDFGGEFFDDPEVTSTVAAHYSVRLHVVGIRDIKHWLEEADLIADRIEVQSLGKSLEIIKDVGDAKAVSEVHAVDQMDGTHGLGHARLATESNVLPNASHPFWARPFPDVAIVHNGQITNYYNWRGRLEREGYRFMTENDSELLAVWISDQMKKGLTHGQALKKSIDEIDGVFTFMISDRFGIGMAKDRFAMKPLVTHEAIGELTAATEEQAVRRIIASESEVTNYDGPALTQLWRNLDLQEAACLR